MVVAAVAAFIVAVLVVVGINQRNAAQNKVVSVNSNTPIESGLAAKTGSPSDMWYNDKPDGLPVATPEPKRNAPNGQLTRTRPPASASLDGPLDANGKAVPASTYADAGTPIPVQQVQPAPVYQVPPSSNMVPPINEGQAPVSGYAQNAPQQVANTGVNPNFASNNGSPNSGQLSVPINGQSSSTQVSQPAQQQQPVPIQGQPQQSIADGAVASGASGNSADPRIALETAGGQSKHKEFIATLRHPPVSVYLIQAGTIIPASLITGIDSNIPGDVFAQVRSDVYDSPTGHHLLIPYGSRVAGTHDNQISNGQTRLPVIWTRIILPNGDSKDIDELLSADARGYGGLAGHLDTHAGQILRNTILVSLLGAGLQLSQPQQSATVGGSPSAGQTIAGSVGQSLGQTAQQLIQKTSSLPNNIRIPEKYEFNIIVNRDMDLVKDYDRKSDRL